MPYEQDIDFCLEGAVGAQGLPQDALGDYPARTAPALARLREARDAGSLPHLTIGARRDDLAAIEEAAARLCDTCDEVVLMGTGGSSLGARTLQAPVPPGTRPRLDEESLGALMMHFMLETILAAGLMGVDPFDRRAVEAGKRLTRQYLETGG